MKELLQLPCLCIVTDSQRYQLDTLVDSLASAVSGGADMIQIREKDLEEEMLEYLTRVIIERVQKPTHILVNGHVQIAKDRAIGVHLPEMSEPIEQVRAVIGSDALIGKSVHSVHSAIIAQKEGVDFLIAGTMFATNSHPGKLPEGPNLIRAMKDSGEVSIPILGIGGITPDNARLVVDAGASGVAVIDSVLGSPDPFEAAKRLKTVLYDSVI